MVKFAGDKAEFTFGSTQYLCLANYRWSGSVADSVAKCSGETGATTVRRAGTPEDQFSFDVIVDAGDITTLNALKRGQVETAFEFHPEGDTALNIEFIATGAVILRSELGGDPDTLGVLSITVGIDGALTIQAAS